MPIQFKQAQLHDHGLPVTLEQAFQSYGAFAGITRFDFDDSYAVGDTGWTTDMGETVVLVSGVAVWFTAADPRVGVWYADGDPTARFAYIAGDSPAWGMRPGIWDVANELVWNDEQAGWL